MKEQAQGYGYSEAHDYEFSSSLYDERKMAYFLILWSGFAPFGLARRGRLSATLDQNSRDIILMTGSDFGFGNRSGQMSYVAKDGGQPLDYMKVW